MHVRARRASAADPQGTAQRALGGTNALPNGSRFDPRAPPEKGVGEQESSKTLPIRHFQEETQRQKLVALVETTALLEKPLMIGVSRHARSLFACFPTVTK